MWDKAVTISKIGDKICHFYWIQCIRVTASLVLFSEMKETADNAKFIFQKNYFEGEVEKSRSLSAITTPSCKVCH